MDYINYLKLLGGLLTIVSCTGIGFSKSNLYRNEIKNLKEFKRIIIYLRGEITHGNSSLPDAIKTIADKEKGVFEEFLKRICKELTTLEGKRFYEVWGNAVENATQRAYLTKPNRERIKNLGKELGHMDKQTQIECLNGFINELDDEIKDKIYTSKDKIRLYNATGVLFGVFVVIMLL